VSGEIVEQEILRLLAKPATEKQAFDLLYKTYAKRLYWHIRYMLGSHNDTDDVLQNVLVKAWKGLKNFRGESKLSSWLFTIATNETISFINQQKKKAVIRNTQRRKAKSLMVQLMPALHPLNGTRQRQPLTSTAMGGLIYL